MSLLTHFFIIWDNTYLFDGHYSIIRAPSAIFVV